MTAGIANTQNKFRRHIKHAKVVGSEIVARDKDCPKTVARNMKPLPHKVYNVKEAMYQEQLPPTNPMIKIKVQVDSKSYQNHKPRLPCGMLMSFLKKTGDQKLELDESRPLPTMELVADTGAQVDIIGVAHINKIGLVREHLLRTAVNLDCANETEATVLGVFFAKISGRSVVTGEETTTKSMVYVIKGKVCLMSKTTLTALGCLPKEFPQIGKYLDTEACQALAIVNNDAHAISDVGRVGPKRFHKPGMVTKRDAIPSHDSEDDAQIQEIVHSAVRQPPGECDPDSPLPCSCPRRQFDNPPDSLPMPATASNREELEQFIRNWYAASAFNACKRQSWPITEGPPMKIFTKPDAVPVCIRKPAAVPLHLRKAVQADINADVAKGVLEKVPYGTPDTWCTRMVITLKKSGKPRRTIDLSALSKACIRETHHTRSPTKVARTVPASLPQ